MTAIWAPLAATIGTVATTLVGVLVGAAVSKRSQDQGWARDQLAHACVQLLAESSQVLAGLGRMNTQRQSMPDGIVVPTSVDWRPWNQAINMINLIADIDIVNAAHQLDGQIWRFHTAIRRKLRSEEEWPALHHACLDAQLAFINNARQLMVSATPVHRLNGKPAADDPIWH